MASRELKIAETVPPKEFVIEDGVSIPRERNGYRRHYPFAELKVGQSFTVPVERGTRTRAAASIWKTNHPGWDYATRLYRSEGILRIWRTK